MSWVTQYAPWSLRLVVGGEDMSERLTGEVRIDAERGAARTLDVTLHTTGTLEPDRYTGRAITLDVLIAGRSHRRFTGVVDEPQVQPGDSTLTLACSDQRVAQLNALSRTDIDALAGVVPHAAFVDDEDTGSEYAAVASAQSLISLEYAADGTAVARDIVTAQAPRLTLDGNDILDASVQLTLARADELVNARTLHARAQRNRYWRRRATLSWDWQRSFAEYLARDHTLPNEGMWNQGVDGLGWFVHSTRFTHLPDSGLYYTDTGLAVPDSANLAPGATGTVGFINRYPELITAASSSVEAWWTQQVTLDATMTFEVADSIARHGRRADEARASLGAGEQGEWATSRTPAARPAVTYTGGLAGGYQYADDNDGARDSAFLAACSARVLRELYLSHSRNRLRIALAWEGDASGPLEPGDTVAVRCDPVIARGLVRRVEESFDIDAGDATQVIELALCRGGSAGATEPSVAWSAPAADALAPTGATAPDDAGALTVSHPAGTGCQLGNDSGTQPAHDPDRLGYAGNFGIQYATPDAPLGDLYPVEILIESPEVPAVHRDTRTVDVPVTVAVTLPEDPLAVSP